MEVLKKTVIRKQTKLSELHYILSGLYSLCHFKCQEQHEAKKTKMCKVCGKGEIFCEEIWKTELLS